jgi:putative transposase
MQSEIPYRKSLRLQDYDYSQPNTFFVTLCANERNYLFGEVVDNSMRLNDAGRAVKHCWLEIPKHFPQVILDEFIIMPNHVHGILIVEERDVEIDPVGANNYSPAGKDNSSSEEMLPSRIKGTSLTLGSIIRGFKIGVTKWFKEKLNISSVWQRNYYEHINRKDEDLNKIREYVIANPLNWEKDDEYIK